MPLPDELARREKRTLGIFLLMLGAGLALDHGPLPLALLGGAAGALLFAWGFAGERQPTRPPPLPASESHS